MRLPLIAVVTALALPASALAADDTTPSASTLCKQQRTAIGATAFKELHGTNKTKSNAFGKCVSKQQKVIAAATTEAKTTCKAERDDPNFAASHDGKTFEQFYGTNKTGSNAYGKCVSGQRKTAVAEAAKTTINAAKTCKAQRKNDPSGFASQWGTRKNAFGKCVSATAKAKPYAVPA